MDIHLKCPNCESTKETGPHYFNVRGQCCTCGWKRDGFVEHFCRDASIIPALRAELLERAEAHEEAVNRMEAWFRSWCRLCKQSLDGAAEYHDLRRELAERCELTDPVVEAAREMFRARDTHPDDIMETAVAVADEVNACGKLRDALRGLEGGDE